MYRCIGYKRLTDFLIGNLQQVDLNEPGNAWKITLSSLQTFLHQTHLFEAAAVQLFNREIEI